MTVSTTDCALAEDDNITNLTCCRLNDTDAASEALGNALKIEPEDGLVWSLYAQALFRTGDVVAVNHAFHAAIKLGADTPDLYARMAEFYGVTSSCAEAEAAFYIARKVCMLFSVGLLQPDTRTIKPPIIE